MGIYFRPDLVSVTQVEYFFPETGESLVCSIDFSLDKTSLEVYIDRKNGGSGIQVGSIPVFTSVSQRQIKSFQDIFADFMNLLSALPEEFEESKQSIWQTLTPENKIIIEVSIKHFVDTVQNLSQAISVWRFPDKTYVDKDDITEIEQRVSRTIDELVCVGEVFSGTPWEFLYCALAEQAEAVVREINGPGADEEDAYILGHLIANQSDEDIYPGILVEYIPKTGKILLFSLWHVSENSFFDQGIVHEVSFGDVGEERLDLEDFLRFGRELDTFFMESIQPEISARWRLAGGDEFVTPGGGILPLEVIKKLYNSYCNAYFIANEQKIPQHRVVEYVSTFLASNLNSADTRRRATNIFNDHLKP
jgi:hypothetical protein